MLTSLAGGVFMVIVALLKHFLSRPAPTAVAQESETVHAEMQALADGPTADTVGDQLREHRFGQ